MQDVARETWTADETALWARIGQHRFERPEHRLTFAGRLARDRGWSLDHARRAIEEYRRFCFLAATGAVPVTPSEEVDEVWHLHLTYSRDYWDVWCREVLRVPLHHDPTEGGSVEQGRYRARYAETLARYEAWFGPPDPVFWPGTAARFGLAPRYRTVDRTRVFVVARPRLPSLWRRAAVLAGAGLALAPRPAVALPLNPLDWDGGHFLVLYAWLAVCALLLAYHAREYLRDTAGAGFVDDLGLLDIAVIAGGGARAADVVALGFVSAGGATLEKTRRRLVVRTGRVVLPPDFEPFRTCAPGLVSRQDFTRSVEDRLGPLRARLVARGLVPDDWCLRRIVRITVLLVGATLAIGGLKVMVGLSRGKPVGFLCVMMIVCLILGVILILKAPMRTTGGDTALARYRDRYARAARAPRDPEVLFAFALAGSAALAGTAYAEYRGYFTATGNGGGDSGSGGDGGGGGCGGCGGGGD